MTVKELIVELEKIDNKNLPIYYDNIRFVEPIVSLDKEINYVEVYENNSYLYKDVEMIVLV